MTTPPGDVPPADVLSVDMVRCAGHGICSLIDAEHITLDEWGFARVDPAPISGKRDRRRAFRAARACPREALFINGLPPAPRRPTVKK